MLWMKQQQQKQLLDASSADEIQMDTNGDGVVDALDEATATETTTTGDASSADEIQMDTNGDGVVDELDTQTPAGTTEATGNASSADEIQMDTNGDGVVDALDEATTEADTATTATDADNDYMPDSTSKPCNPNSPTLRIGKDGTVGSKGPKVTELQSDLTDLGYEKFLGPQVLTVSLDRIPKVQSSNFR